jgi:hypothetical protein
VALVATRSQSAKVSIGRLTSGRCSVVVARQSPELGARLSLVVQLHAEPDSHQRLTEAWKQGTAEQSSYDRAKVAAIKQTRR